MRRGARKVVLNDEKELDYFQSHIPAIGPRAKATWVFRSPPGDRARAGDTPFVRIGAPLNKVRPTSFPSVRARISSPVARTTKVTLDQAKIPQLGLPVTIVVRRSGRPVAAGTAVLDSLDRRQTATVSVPLTGRPGREPASLIVVPTIFN